MQKHKRHLQRAIQLMTPNQKSFGGNVDDMDITPQTVFQIRTSEVDSTGDTIYIFEDAQHRMFRVNTFGTYEGQIKGPVKVMDTTKNFGNRFSAKDATGFKFTAEPLKILTPSERLMVPAGVSTPPNTTPVQSAQQQQHHVQHARPQQTAQGHDLLTALQRNGMVQEIEAKGDPYKQNLLQLEQRHERGELTEQQFAKAIKELHNRVRHAQQQHVKARAHMQRAAEILSWF